MRTRVLLLDGHTIQVLPFLKAYAALNVEVTIFCENKLSYGYFSVRNSADNYFDLVYQSVNDSKK